MNYTINLNLQKLEGAFLTKIKGKTQTKECLCIPVKDAHLVVGDKGTYVDIVAIEVREENRKTESTHLLRHSLPKEVYQAMSEEERRAMPAIGGLKPLPSSRQEVKVEVIPEDNSDLPF